MDRMPEGKPLFKILCILLILSFVFLFPSLRARRETASEWGERKKLVGKAGKDLDSPREPEKICRLLEHFHKSYSVAGV